MRLLLLALLIASTSLAQPQPTGEWMVSASLGLGLVSFRADTEATSTSFRFRPKGTSMLLVKSGSYKDGQILMDVVVPLGEATMTGKLVDGKITGEWRTKSGQSRGTWSAVPAQKKEEMTPEQRADAVETLWKQIRDVYIFFNDKKLNYEELRDKYAALSKASKTDAEYYSTIRELITELNDGHANLVVNPAAGYLGKPPFECRLAEGKLLISKLTGSSDLKVGDEIIEVDGKPVAEAIQDAIKSRAFPVATTRTARGAAAVGGGEAGTELKLKVRRDGTELDVTCTRLEAGPNSAGKSETPFRDLGDGIGSIKLETFLTPEAANNFDEALKMADKMKGLIIDLRGNGGGNLMLAQRIFGRLLDKEATGTKVWTRGSNGLPTESEASSAVLSRIRPPSGDTPRFAGKVALLCDEFCFSAAEIFLVLFRENKRGQIFGRQTGGGAGAVSIRKMEPEGFVSFSSIEIRGAQGSRIEGVGVKPDVSVPFSIDEALGREDKTMLAAKSWLLKETGHTDGFHLMLQPMLGFWSGFGISPAKTASSAWRRSAPFTGLSVPGLLSSSRPL